MPITLLYCAAEHPPAIVAAGDCASAIHHHEDGSTHPTTAITGVDEVVPAALPHTMADGTVVATHAAWLTALEGHLP